MVNLLCKEGKLKKAKDFITTMESLGLKPNVVTYNTIINGYCIKNNLDGAKQIFNRMKAKGIQPDTYSYGSLITGMCKDERFNEASELLNKMEESNLVPTAISYNSIIDAYCNTENLEMAFRYKDQMVKKGVQPSVSTYNSLIHAMMFEGKESEAEDMMEEMRKENLIPDAITYNILINGYCRVGKSQQAFNLHDEMITKGINPTHVTYTSLINLLSKRNKMTEADNLFSKILERGVLPDVMMFNSLIDGHCANKNMERAVLYLKEMYRVKVCPDVVTYNTLMQGHCREGRVEEAIRVFDEMKKRGIEADFVSYNTIVSGYSRRGDMKEALKVRDEMVIKGFSPTLLTYNALIQGLCKNNERDYAQELLKEMISKDWARVLEAATQRRTEVLQPENLENMWTKGRNYKKKAQKNAAKGQNGNIKKDKDKIETSSSEKFPPRPHNTDLSNSLSLDGGFEGSSSKVKFRKSNSASDLIKETRVETGYAGQVSGSIISEFYSANVGRHDVPSVNVASDKVLRIEGCVPKLKCRDLLSIANVAEQHEVWDFLSISSKNYSFGKSSSVMRTLAVNVDDAVDDIVRQFKGVSDGLILKVVGPTFIYEPMSSSASNEENGIVDSAQLNGWHSDNELNSKGFPPRVVKHDDLLGSLVSEKRGSSRVRSQVLNLAANFPSTSDYLEDPLGVPAEWTPPNVSVPLLNLVDKIFQLNRRGWLRRQVLWPEGIFFTRVPTQNQTGSYHSDQDKPKTATHSSGSKGGSFEEQLEAARRASDSAVCLKQLAYGLLELVIVTVFPELHDIVTDANDEMKEAMVTRIEHRNDPEEENTRVGLSQTV
ncbi:hypothetical protein LXL04_018007 [Taraxacum kok-saghyz]